MIKVKGYLSLTVLAL